MHFGLVSSRLDAIDISGIGLNTWKHSALAAVSEGNDQRVYIVSKSYRNSEVNQRGVPFCTSNVSDEGTRYTVFVKEDAVDRLSIEYMGFGSLDF